MARIRTIKPELFLDEELGALTGDHLALFAGLLTLADREGRLEDRPVRIKASLFPYRDVDVTGLMDGLERIGKVGRYVVEGVACVVIWGFPKHQRPHPKEPQSALPAPPSREKKRPAVFGSSCIPSSPVGREGKGREGDLGREGDRKPAPMVKPPPPEPVTRPALPPAQTPLDLVADAYERVKGTRPRWGVRQENDLRPLISAGWSAEEIATRAERGFRRTKYPTVANTADLARFWDHLAGEATEERDWKKGRVGAEEINPQAFEVTGDITDGF